MAITPMSAITWKFTGKPWDLNSLPLSPDQVWAMLDLPPEEVRLALNGIIGMLNSVLDGSSGANNVAMTPIASIGTQADIQTVVEAIVTRLQSAVAGLSGAKFIGVETIAGLTGNDVQTLLSALKTYSDGLNTAQTNALSAVNSAQTSALNTHKGSTDHNGLYYTETEIDSKVTTLNNTDTANANALTTHKSSADHDGRYYTESEIDTKVTTLNGVDTTNASNLTTHKASSDHDGRYFTETEVNSLDAQNAKLTGTQTIAGVKTFSSSPIVPTPTTDMQASPKKYVDDNFTTKNEITATRKLSATGDFTGTLNGMAIVASEPGLSTEVAGAHISAVKAKTFATIDARFEESEQDLVTYKADNTKHTSGWVNVEDYTGVGISDVTAIRNANAALNALGGGTLIFPKDYLIDDFTVTGDIAIEVFSNITYEGVNGATLKVADGTNTPSFGWQAIFGSTVYGVSNVRFKGLTFDMNGLNNLFPVELAPPPTIRNGALYFTYPFNLLVSDCTFKNCPGLNSISTGHAENVIIENCRFLEFGKSITGNVNITDHSCIMGTGDGYIVKNNRFVNTTLCNISTAMEIDCPNALIDGNYVKNVNIACLISSNGVVGVDNYIVTNNIFESVKTGVSLWNYSVGVVVQNIKITKNKMIAYNAEDTDRFFIDLYTYVANAVKGIIIEDNEFSMPPTTATSNYLRCIGIQEFASDVIIRRNKITNFTGYAILVRGTTTDIKITDNILVDNCNTTNAGEIYHIVISPTGGKYVSGIFIERNHIENKLVTHATYAICMLSDCRVITLHNNNIKNVLAFNLNGMTLTNTSSLSIIHNLLKNETFFNIPASIGSMIYNPYTGRKHIKKTSNLAIGVWNIEFNNGGFPTSEDWVKGDKGFNNNQAAGGYDGWVCITSGTPGTWKGFGLIQA